MSRAMSRVAICVALLGMLGVGACGPSRKERPLVDEKLMLALEEAQAWQHRADIHLADGEAGDAEHDVEQVLAIKFPPGALEGEEARLDAWARLAKLHAASDEAKGFDDIEHARREVTHDSFFSAHVELVSGELHEARARRLEASDKAAATEAKRVALADYARSIDINKRVQASLLEEQP